MTKKSISSLTFRQSVSVSKRLLSIGWQTRPSMILGYFSGAALEIAGSVGSIYATARLGGLLAGFVSNGQSNGVWLWLWLDILAGLVITTAFLIMRYCNRLMYFELVRKTTKDFLITLNTMDIPDYYDEERRNHLNKVGNTYTWQIPNLYDANMDLIYGVVRFLVITVVVAQINWWIVPIIAIFLIPSLLSERKIAGISWFVWDEKGDERHIFWGLDYLVRQVKAQMEIRSTAAQKYLVNKIDRMNEVFYSEQEKLFIKANKMQFSTRVLESAGTGIGAIVLLRQLLSKTITLERYFFLSGALFRVGSALNAVFGTLSRMQEPMLYAKSYFELVDLKPKLVDKPNAEILVNAQAPEIRIENLSFTYPGQTDAVFKNMNLTIAPGEHIALVGENGAGKSTLIKLLLRFYLPDERAIYINGVNINDIAIESWYNQIATLFQDFNHYPMSIEENITIGRTNKKPDTKLRDKAGKFSNVDSQVEKYKYGWDTVLDSSFKKGTEPSGGQWQRVALARAFYRQANLLILDEPTSAIDAKTEYEIFNNIFTHFQDKSAIIVSHRFSTVRRADRIVVLEQGKIVEEGSHKDLIRKKGIYFSLFSSQAEGYKD